AGEAGNPVGAVVLVAGIEHVEDIHVSAVPTAQTGLHRPGAAGERLGGVGVAVVPQGRLDDDVLIRDILLGVAGLEIPADGVAEVEERPRGRHVELDLGPGVAHRDRHGGGADLVERVGHGQPRVVDTFLGVGVRGGHVGGVHGAITVEVPLVG